VTLIQSQDGMPNNPPQNGYGGWTRTSVAQFQRLNGMPNNPHRIVFVQAPWGAFRSAFPPQRYWPTLIPHYHRL